MKIEILGTGCRKCRLLEEQARKVVTELGLDAEIEHVTDVSAIVSRGVMMTPALVVDGVVKTVGQVPSEADMKRLLG